MSICVTLVSAVWLGMKVRYDNDSYSNFILKIIMPVLFFIVFLSFIAFVVCTV